MKTSLSHLQTHQPRLIGEDHFFKAAVCICLIETEEDWDLLFEVRSGNIPSQPKDVCLPGGEVEPGETYQDAAVRETCEELLIRPEQLTIIGASDYIHSANTLIRPFAGILTDYRGTFQRDEVEEVFRVPLRFFTETEPARHIVDIRMQPREDFPYELIHGGRNYKWRSRRTEELFYQYNGRVIWGLTARMVSAFCRLL